MSTNGISSKMAACQEFGMPTYTAEHLSSGRRWTTKKTAPHIIHVNRRTVGFWLLICYCHDAVGNWYIQFFVTFFCLISGLFYFLVWRCLMDTSEFAKWSGQVVFFPWIINPFVMVMMTKKNSWLLLWPEMKLLVPMNVAATPKQQRRDKQVIAVVHMSFFWQKPYNFGQLDKKCPTSSSYHEIARPNMHACPPKAIFATAMHGRAGGERRLQP